MPLASSQSMPVDHYENFPVASLLLPPTLREPVEALYVFARSADDIADEGDASAETRQAQLAAYHRELDAIARGDAPCRDDLAPIFGRLAQAVRRHDLPLPLLHDLLHAFEQDTWRTRYTDYDDVLDYCRRSANPVGRLLLQLYQAATADNLACSDRICTALQLINFWQDVAIDWQKDRIYLPQADLQQFGVTEAALERRHRHAHQPGSNDSPSSAEETAWRALMRFQVMRARELMMSGAPLARRLPGRIGWELRLIVLGGLRTLERIEAVDYDVFRHRPTLNKSDWLRLAWRALRYPSADTPTFSPT